MKTYIVQLETHDDVISARDKISWSKAQRVLLVLPKRGGILQRRIDLLMLQRYCQQSGYQLALVTGDRQVKEQAALVALPVFRSKLQAQKSLWHIRHRKKSFSVAERTFLSPEDLRAQQKVVSTAFVYPRAARILAFAAGVLAILALALFLIPSAQVRVLPNEQDQRLTLAVWASPQVNAVSISGGLPVHALQGVVEGRKTGQSSGKTSLAERAASGLVEFTNLTDQPVEAPAGVVALTADTPPVRFVTSQPLYLAGKPGEKAQVAVLAVNPGVGGNVAGGAIRAVEGALGARVAVRNPAALQGGMARVVPSPTKGDYDAARESLLETLRLNAYQELQAQNASGKIVLLPSVKLRSVQKEADLPEADQPADQFTLTLRAEFDAWYVEGADLQAAAGEALNVTLPKGFSAVEGSMQTHSITEPAVDSGGAIRWNVEVTRRVRASLATDRVVALAAGKTPGEAVRQMQAVFGLTTPPQIRILPQGWFLTPFFAARIQVVQP